MRVRTVLLGERCHHDQGGPDREREARGDPRPRRDHGHAAEDPRRVSEVRPLRGVLGHAADPRRGRTDDAAKFNVGKDSVIVKAVDPAHVAMVELTLDRGAFEAYKADEGELGVDMDKMKEILRLAKGGETISLSHDEDKNRLIVAVGNTTRRMALVDTAGMSDPKVPSLNLPVKLTVRTDELRH